MLIKKKKFFSNQPKTDPPNLRNKKLTWYGLSRRGEKIVNKHPALFIDLGSLEGEYLIQLKKEATPFALFNNSTTNYTTQNGRTWCNLKNQRTH